MQLPVDRKRPENRGWNRLSLKCQMVIGGVCSKICWEEIGEGVKMLLSFFSEFGLRRNR